MFQSLHHRILSLLFPAAVAAGTLLAACQFDPSPASAPDPVSGPGVTVELQVRPVVLAKAASTALQPTDSADIRISGPGMDPKEFGFGAGSDTFSLPELSPGPGRHFEVRLFYQKHLLYLGTADTTLYTDRKNTVFMHCIPQFSMVAASVHVPVDFPRKVGRTELRLWNATDTLVIGPDQPGEFLDFHLNNVPGNQNYSLKFSLWDDTGALAATSVQDTLWVPMGQSISLDLPLVTTFSQLQMNMTVSDPQQTTVSFSFPAGRRVPATFGEVVFSEVYLSPTTQDSSSQGQWIELYNRTSDTLDLSGCKMTRDGGGSTSKQAVLASGTIVAPNRGLVVGRSAYPNADVRFPSFSLGTGLSHMQFSCKSGALNLDTMVYSLSASDSTAVQTAAGKVTELRPDWVGQRTNPVGWCEVPAHPTDPSQGWPTPGTLENGCGN